MSTAVVVALVTFAASCGARGSGEGQEAGADVPFETIHDASYSGLDEPLREVVRDAARWAEIWDLVQGRTSPRPPPPSVDFSRDMLVVVAAGTRRSGGYAIAVRGLSLRGETLDVDVLESCPAPGDMVTGASSQPIAIVRLERLAQAAAFHASRSPSCPGD